MTDEKRKDWDAIVIGSGMGGMAAAAALSKVGHKVLLLEQYQTLGGLSHSFSIEGFSWDVGIHYLNCVAPEDREHRILDWLSDTPIEFVSMGAVYDNLHIGDAVPLPPLRGAGARSQGPVPGRGGGHRRLDRRAQRGSGSGP
jgi:all-trans-retinol 13,14-reductase